ncbi:NHD1 [Symbiodinium pilosum]|uniref:NHD1 protein n=1 Tax=Symbiodinium pilosum TaxID=2952 RepID=A0A812XKT5_SYMPI|nr:NHD1 [Symbiodinium pilosum]
MSEDPMNGRAYWRAATAALGLDRPDTAAALCMRGIKVLGDSDTLSSLLEEAKQKLEEAKRNEEGIQTAPACSEEEPSIASELSERAAALLRSHRNQDEAERKFDDVRRAVKLFQASLQEDPKNEDALIGLGEILDEGLGGLEPDPDAARVMWMQAATTGSQRAQVKLCPGTWLGHTAAKLFLVVWSNVSGLARVVASLGGYMIFTTGILLSEALGYNVGSLEDAAAFIVFFDLGSCYTVWTLRSHINLRFLIALWLPWVIFELIGTRVLIANSESPWLKRSFGILLFVVLVVDAFEQYRKRLASSPSSDSSPQKAQAVGHPTLEGANDAVPAAAPEDAEGVEAGEMARVLQKQPRPIGFDVQRPRDLAKAVVLGATGGLLKGMYTVPMPALTMFILFSGIDKDMWRANAVCNSVAGLPTKAYYLFVMEKRFDKRRIPQYVATVLGVICATPLGNFISRRINKETFKDIVRALTFTGACSMLAAGTSVAAWVVLAAFSFSGAVAFCRHRGRAAGEGQRPNVSGPVTAPGEVPAASICKLKVDIAAESCRAVNTLGYRGLLLERLQTQARRSQQHEIGIESNNHYTNNLSQLGSVLDFDKDLDANAVELPSLEPKAKHENWSSHRQWESWGLSCLSERVRGLVKLLGIGVMVRVQVMSVLFAAGLFIVAVEDVVGINKSAMMMVLAAVMWTFLAVGYHPNNSKAGYMQLHEELNRGLEEVGSVLLFLLPAMGVVESIDHFDGFALANMAIRRAIEGRKDRLMPIICILTFFLSSVIDNLTSTIVAVKILRRLASEDEEYRRLCGGLAVIAANAGGAWSPIGDVTTTMLWIQEKITATNTVLWLFFPSFAAGVLPLWGLRCQARRLIAEPSPAEHRIKDRKKGPGWEQEPLKEAGLEEDAPDHITRQKVVALTFGVLCILMVPGLKMGCGLPPYLGMLLALGLMWLLTDVLHFQGHLENGAASPVEDHGPPQLGVVSALRKVDLTGLLFFTGVLLAIGALNAAGVLKECGLISDPADSLVSGSGYGDFGAGTGERRVGVIKNWNHERGFGFLRTEGLEKDTFFPRRELPPEFQGETALNGITFAYDVASATDGRPQARNLQFVGGAAQTIPTNSPVRVEGFGNRCVGQVKSFSGKGGYGFMSITATGADIFFAKRDLPAGMQEANLIGLQFEFDVGSSNDGRSQAKNLVCVDPSSTNFGAVGPSGKGHGKGLKLRKGILGVIARPGSQIQATAQISSKLPTVNTVEFWARSRSLGFETSKFKTRHRSIKALLRQACQCHIYLIYPCHLPVG